jgi:hypothetical protein
MAVARYARVITTGKGLSVRGMSAQDMAVQHCVADDGAICLDIPRASEWAARSGDWRHIVAATARSHNGMERIAAGGRHRNDTGTHAEWRRSLGAGRVLR